jgi:hypothetical protein
VVQAACRDRADQAAAGGQSAIDHVGHRRRSAVQGASQARTAQRPRPGRRRHRCGGARPPRSAAGSGRGAAVWHGAGWSPNQVARQKLIAQFARDWWRRIEVSERTWKSAQPSSSLALVTDYRASIGLCPKPTLPSTCTIQAADLGLTQFRVSFCPAGSD